MKLRNRPVYLGLSALVLFATTGFIFSKSTLDLDAKTQLCEDVATLFRSARAVISKNQALINNASKGDKGLTGKTVIAAAKANYEKATGKAWVMADAATLSGQSQKAMFQSIEEVMEQAQPLINEQGKGFKGFLPAVFAKQVADHFSKHMAGKMFIKLTAPKSYVRNRANRPDAWEHAAIENLKSRAGKRIKHFLKPKFTRAKPLFVC